MLTPSDIQNPDRKSGFDHVRHMGKPGRPKPWQAQVYGPNAKHGNGLEWAGPYRATPDEAAQDYCDYANSNAIHHRPRLNSAGHPQRPSTSRTPEVEAALDTLRQHRERQRAQRQGYVYCMGMEGDDYAVKIGHSTAPECRPSELQIGNPRRLVILATIPGTEDDERALHRKFAHLNILGEWFYKTPEILAEFQTERAAA